MGGVFVTTGTTCEAPLEEQQQLIFKGQAEMGVGKPQPFGCERSC